jgi:hypothetical protein|tara:strand:- start:2372 stop:2797 length:426 start_codon:yes stop_codon:yes gene_type:complete
MSLTPSFFSGGGRRDAEQVVVDDLIATENMQLGHIVRTVIGDVTGVLAKAENTTNNVIGVSKFDVSSGSVVEVIQSGIAKVIFDSDPTTSDIGKRVYVGASGVATLTPTQTSGHYIIQLGYLIDSATPKIVLRIDTLHKFS